MATISKYRFRLPRRQSHPLQPSILSPHSASSDVTSPRVTSEASVSVTGLWLTHMTWLLDLMSCQACHSGCQPQVTRWSDYKSHILSGRNRRKNTSSMAAAACKRILQSQFCSILWSAVLHRRVEPSTCKCNWESLTGGVTSWCIQTAVVVCTYQLVTL